MLISFKTKIFSATLVYENNEFTVHLTTKWYEEDDFITYCSAYTQLKNMNLDIVEEIGSPPGNKRTLNPDGFRKCAFMFLCMVEYQ